MKKFLLSLSVFAASAGYIAYQHPNGSIATSNTPNTAPITTVVVPPTTETIPVQPKPPVTTKPIPAPIAAPTPTPTPAPKPTGQYADGVYTGAATDAYYGIVQIRATIQGGKLVTVDFLQYPNDRQNSIRINTQAMPLLKSEAIQAQSANVSGVSGATATSEAFVTSLGDALAQAKI